MGWSKTSSMGSLRPSSSPGAGVRSSSLGAVGGTGVAVAAGALATGERRVSFGDKTVEYRSVAELQAAIRSVEAARPAAQVKVSNDHSRTRFLPPKPFQRAIGRKNSRPARSAILWPPMWAITPVR